MNQSLFLLINGWAGQIGWLDSLMFFCAEYLMYVMILAVLAYAIKNYPKWKDMALVSIVSALMARFVVASGIRFFYFHPRPYLVITNLHLLLNGETASSFPSGHAIFMFALATGVYLYNKRAGWWFYASACVISFARIFVGVHWPYDILAGAVLGILTAYILNWLFVRYKYTMGL